MHAVNLPEKKVGFLAMVKFFTNPKQQCMQSVRKTMAFLVQVSFGFCAVLSERLVVFFYQSDTYLNSNLKRLPKLDHDFCLNFLMRPGMVRPLQKVWGFVFGFLLALLYLNDSTLREAGASKS